MLAGPTAVGKTALSIKLAQAYDSVILSADSRQFYKELNIGTAKPHRQQLQEVQHFFINTKNIGDLYGAGHFEKDAIGMLKTLFEKHHVVFMVGGSGLYIDAVLNGVDDFEEVPISVRAAINQEYEVKGLEWLQKSVEEIDPEYYRTVDPKNPQRLIRSLELMRHTGRTYSSFLDKGNVQREFKAVKILLNRSRPELYKRINERVDEMMAEGLLAEAKQFFSQKNTNALKTVGYKELYEHLEGKYDLSTAIEKIKQHTRNYAKRQLTWFKNRDLFTELEASDFETIKAFIDEQLKDD
ncbi:MAG: tRNA (adenosine(37)-N6)-dimethylallyltransferase MiaA [bacterium]|nr:tRNA (adenosine(37)-N6)-dimethylallyltransferase MiaA [bacterium]